MLSEVHQPASEIDAKLQRGHASGRALGNVAKRVEGLPIAGHAFPVGPSHVSLLSDLTAIVERFSHTNPRAVSDPRLVARELFQLDEAG